MIMLENELKYNELVDFSYEKQQSESINIIKDIIKKDYVVKYSVSDNYITINGTIFNGINKSLFQRILNDYV